MDELIQLERKVQGLYDKALFPLANRLAFEVPVSQKDAAGLPSVLFLGNHSSGKSTFINHLISADLQKTGLAPTDDGFTVITYGEKQDEFDGQTVVTHPDLPYKALQHLGPAFVARLRLKTFPHDLLKSVTLIDSPGMIDAAGTSYSRGYDFGASVRYFAEKADLILFFFDPDKPGTTGETVSIFTETLAGLEYKLLIVMNKVDLFPNIRDFARTYGTLCWNLSKTIKTKDIPHIFNTYLPTGHPPGPHRESSVPLHDFDLSRNEVITEIKRAPTRRADNLVSDLYQSARKLEIHTRVCSAVAQDVRRLRNKLWAGVALIVVLTGFSVWLTRTAESIWTPVLAGIIGLAVALAAGNISYMFFKRYKRQVISPEGLEPYFETAFRRELILQDRADLRALWDGIKKQAANSLQVIPPEKIAYTFALRKPLRRLDDLIHEEVPKLRREIADYHTQRRPPQAEPVS